MPADVQNKATDLLDRKVLNGILMAREWLGLLYSLDYSAEDRAVKAIEVAQKLSAQMCVLGMEFHDIKKKEIAAGLSSMRELDVNARVGVRAIQRYAIAKQMPDHPELVAKLLLMYNKNSENAIAKTEGVKTIDKKVRPKLVTSLGKQRIA